MANLRKESRNKDARLYHLEGVIRTQAILLKEGKIKP